MVRPTSGRLELLSHSSRSFLAGFAKDAVYHKHTYTDETEQYVYSTSVNYFTWF